jgi:hypothetical protein
LHQVNTPNFSFFLSLYSENIRKYKRLQALDLLDADQLGNKKMKKIWFIVKDDEHLGPYDHHDLKDFHREKKIEMDTKIWKKGLPKAIFYSEINLYVTAQKKSKKYKTKEQEVIQKLESGLKVLQHQEPFKLPGTKKEFPWSKVALSFAATVILAAMPFVFELVSLSSKSVSMPSGMKKADHARLVAASSNAFEELTSSYAASKDMSEIFMATNFPFDGRVRLKMTSVQGKMLRPEIVVIESEGMLKDRIAVFNNLKYDVGTRLVPGYYQFTVELVGKPAGSYFIENFMDLPKKFSVQTVELVSVLPKSVYDDKLARAQALRDNAEKRIWFELQQKYLTVKAVVEQIKSELFMVYSENVEEVPWENNLSAFESKYDRYFGVFFAKFANQEYSTIPGYDTIETGEQRDVKNYYKDLVSITTNAANDSARSLRDLKKTGRVPSSQDWDWLKGRIERRYEKLLARLDDGLVIIDSKLTQ